MGIIVIVVLLIVVRIIDSRRKAPRPIQLMYPSGVGKLVGDWVVFPCNCRFHVGTQNRFLCAAHQEIFSLAVKQ